MINSFYNPFQQPPSSLSTAGPISHCLPSLHRRPHLPLPPLASSPTAGPSLSTAGPLSDRWPPLAATSLSTVGSLSHLLLSPPLAPSSTASSLQSTMNIPGSFSSSSRAQTPLCKCGIPAREYTCHKEGKYKGKQLYGCDNYPEGCKFFGVKKEGNSSRVGASSASPSEDEMKNFYSLLRSIEGSMYRLEDQQSRIVRSIENVNYGVSRLLKGILFVLVAMFIMLFWFEYWRMY